MDRQIKEINNKKRLKDDNYGYILLIREAMSVRRLYKARLVWSSFRKSCIELRKGSNELVQDHASLWREQSHWLWE